MCGLAGFVDTNINYDISKVIDDQLDLLKERGPDSKGHYIDYELGLVLLHRRLAIIDLSSSGLQPMQIMNGRYLIVYNGEIYNYLEIKNHLQKKYGPIDFKSNSDTEVILYSFELEGVVATIDNLEGMFAIVLWDKIEKKFILIRDRMGEKPLYYGFFNNVFAFASDLKAITIHPKFEQQINKDAVWQLFMHNCIPAPLSIYDGIFKLQPAHYVEVSYKDIIHKKLNNPKSYWNLIIAIDDKIVNKRYDLNEKQFLINKLDILLNTTIKRQMIADVDIGCFLSGGIDSSLVAAIMQKNSSVPINTFSIGFFDKKYNEAHFAKQISQFLKTNHNELYVNEQEALNVIEKLPFIYSEPFADSSQIPTFLLSKMTKQKVTVSLSGDGGDELFLGYSRYFRFNKIASFFNYTPQILRDTLDNILLKTSKTVINQLSLYNIALFRNIVSKIDKLSYIYQGNNFQELYLRFISHWFNINELMLGNGDYNSLWYRDLKGLNNNFLKMQYMDTLGYLPDDILVKVDRASMANSLETRAPFLNHKVVEFAFNIPLVYKIGGNQGKEILKELLYKYIDKKLFQRPKSGFGIPLNSWLRGALRDWAMDLLDAKKISEQGLFNQEVINNTLVDHLKGRKNNGYYLWDILMFQLWYEKVYKNIKNKSVLLDN